ncbi:Golgi apparatus protein 1 [Liparis tanakae]|uniref:Golgi apparatus protein 1 n=1 Tax=Liparis tanakae TaxID=230148 RepID=A0A4Z2FC27_9TELE|nr:Golgi apparatus protein 1 [Liparis tanakae]
MSVVCVLISPTAPERSSRLTGSVKMADCIRVPLLLLLICVFSSLRPTRGQNNAMAKLAPNADSPQKPAGGPGPAAERIPVAAAERNPGAAASPPRKRSAGWKLAEEGVCKEDLTRLCPKHSWNNNLAVLECLQDRKEVTSAGRGVSFCGEKEQGVPRCGRRR